MINEDTRCGPADDWGVALVRYWLAKRSGERAIREARERTAQARQDRHGRRHRRQAAK